MADISADIRDEISDIVTYLDNYFLFCLRDRFILFYIHSGISMMFLFDVWIKTYFFLECLICIDY